MSTNNNQPNLKPGQDDDRVGISVSVNVHVKRIVITYNKAVSQVQFTREQATKHIEALQTGLKALGAIDNESNA